MLLAPKNRHFLALQRPNMREEGSAGSASAAAATTASSQQQADGTIKKNEVEKQPITTTWFLRMCKLLNLLTGLAAILGIITNISILPIPSPPPDVALRLYGIVLCTLSLLTECEWARLFTWFAVLESWVGRGLNNIFCAVLILVVDDTTAVTDGESEGDAARTWLLRKMGGNFLLAMGFIYLIGGMLCLGQVKNRHLSKIRKRDQALVQKHELEHRKNEIELLLRETESQLEKI